ncbi:MAG: PA14 domain-containing protein [Planctomycetaceae bacterium]
MLSMIGSDISSGSPIRRCDLTALIAFAFQMCCVCWIGLSGSCSIAAADEFDDEPQSGLLAEISQAGKSVYRLDARPAFDWQNFSPDVRVGEGAYRIDWRGVILIREPGVYRFHGRVQGKVKLYIEDQLVLETETDSIGFATSESCRLSAGEFPVRIEFRSGADNSSIQLFWSSDRFTLEPLPADVFYVSQDILEQLDLGKTVSSPDISVIHSLQRGAQLSDGLRCAACHRSAADIPVLPAPNLARIADAATPSAVIDRLVSTAPILTDSRMPHFALSQKQAEQIAAFLFSVAQKPRSEKPLKIKENDVQRGDELLLSTGCIACHELPRRLVASEMPATRDATYSGPSFDGIEARRDAQYILRWLRDPASLNSDHRMPVFDLSDDERRQIAASLTWGSKKVAESPDKGRDVTNTEPGDVDAGRKLVRQLRCYSCHAIPGMDNERETRVDLAVQMSVDNLEPGGCLSKNSVGGSTPRFSLDDRDRQALVDWYREFLSSRGANDDGVHRLSSMDHGQRVIQRKQCLACHDRDQSRGLSAIAGKIEQQLATLRGRSQAFVPPSLTAVGDKLNDAYLAKAVAGQQGSGRLPWLSVRMPKFAHTPEESESLLAYFLTADRIPDSADSAREDIVKAAVAGETSTEDLLIGNQLTGAGGFNCVACHQAGAFEPRNVALGTRGSDLLTMGQRLRPRFFQRWMKNPIRVVAGIEMPAIKRATPGVLDEDLSNQMSVIWKAIRDPRFTAPTVVSRYEQFVNVGPGEPPRIIRDVFTLGEDKNREGVARSFAIGLGNGHNLLIDLDTLQLRQWTIGEFARQRTEGKSWFWSTAGIEVIRQPNILGPPEFLFQLRTNGSGILSPVEDEGRISELTRYTTDATGVTLWHRIRFPVSDNSEPRSPAEGKTRNPHSAMTAWDNPQSPVRTVTIRERIEALDFDGKTGWTRAFYLEDVDPNLQLVTMPGVSIASTNVPTARMEQSGPDPASGEKSDGRRLLEVNGIVPQSIPRVVATELPVIMTTAEPVTTVPGFRGERLPLPTNIMPTAIAWQSDGSMVFTSLKGHVWIARDTDGDGAEDSLSLFEEGLSAPFGVVVDGDSVIVSHKPEVLRLRDSDGDGRADVREVVASGWGLTDDYHDWTSGLIRDTHQNLYVGLGSDYSQKGRPENRDRWRGTVLKIDPSGIITPIAFGFRYPMGLAFDGSGRLYATDNQGVQNTFNEINHIVQGAHYGVPSRHFADDSVSHETPALQIPHPWTRSVNSILFFPKMFQSMGLAGQGVGCEYDLRFLIRFNIQQVNGVMQGASYPLSLPDQAAGGSNFIGPICSAISPAGELYVGSIWDSGWQGGPNTGGIEKLIPDVNSRPNGIREVEATVNGFRIHFFDTVDGSGRLSRRDSYSVQGYTRVWGGSYATPDSEQHSCEISSVVIADDQKSIELRIEDLRQGSLYDLSIRQADEADGPETPVSFWPSEAHYFLKKKPTQ